MGRLEVFGLTGVSTKALGGLRSPAPACNRLPGPCGAPVRVKSAGASLNPLTPLIAQSSATGE